MARPRRTGPAKIRVNLELPPSAKDRLVRCRELSEADSYQETVRYALLIYEKLLDGEVCLMDVRTGNDVKIV